MNDHQKRKRSFGLQTWHIAIAVRFLSVYFDSSTFSPYYTALIIKQQRAISTNVSIKPSSSPAVRRTSAFFGKSSSPRLSTFRFILSNQRITCTPHSYDLLTKTKCRCWQVFVNVLVKFPTFIVQSYVILFSNSQKKKPCGAHAAFVPTKAWC